jgi:GMP synthase-like glutamine amidotransferase
MKSLFVVQHTDSEFLGRMEDHLEGRGIRFTYLRPHTGPRQLPGSARFIDGLVLLGGGPWAASGDRRLPTLDAEISLCKECLALGKPVIGIGLGAQILALAAGGAVAESPLVFAVDEARRIVAPGLNGFLPAQYPLAIFMRGWPQPPEYARVLAVDSTGRPALFQVGENSFGFAGHPGAKRAMVEDLMMEFDETPEFEAAELERLSAAQPALEESLVRIMTGLIQLTGLMRPAAQD